MQSWVTPALSWRTTTGQCFLLFWIPGIRSTTRNSSHEIFHFPINAFDLLKAAVASVSMAGSSLVAFCYTYLFTYTARSNLNLKYVFLGKDRPDDVGESRLSCPPESDSTWREVLAMPGWKWTNSFHSVSSYDSDTYIESRKTQQNEGFHHPCDYYLRCSFFRQKALQSWSISKHWQDNYAKLPWKLQQWFVLASKPGQYIPINSLL